MEGGGELHKHDAAPGEEDACDTEEQTAEQEAE